MYGGIRHHCSFHTYIYVILYDANVISLCNYRMPCLLACLPGIQEIEAVKNTVSYDVIFYVKIKLLVLAREQRLRVHFVFPGEALHRRPVVEGTADLILVHFTRKFT